MVNGEENVRLHSVIAHETETGYAQCFREDAYNPRMGDFELRQIRFSAQVQREWHDPQLFQRLLAGESRRNPGEV
jgi:6-pyruvoyltetrahydropterin/6-carboxytetrahydropterin synthase